MSHEKQRRLHTAIRLSDASEAALAVSKTRAQRQTHIVITYIFFR